MSKVYSAGDEVDSYCTRCRLNLNHTIIAMVGPKVVKVKCKTCGSVHSYRNVDKIVKSSSRESSSPESRSAPVRTVEAVWQARVNEAKGPEIPYDMGRVYRAGDVVVHAVFGKGIVQRADYKKCTMLFRDKERVLVTANT